MFRKHKENKGTEEPNKVDDSFGEDFKSENDKDKQDSVENISYFALFRFSSSLDKVLIGIALIAAFVVGVLMPCSVFLVADFFQSMIKYDMDSKMKKGDSKQFLHEVHTFCFKYLSIAVLTFLCAYLSTSLMCMTAGNQIHRLRIAYLKAILNQDLAYFDTHETQDYAAKMGENVATVKEGIGDKVATLVITITSAFGCILMALIRGWKLALICLVGMPVSCLLVALTGICSQRLAQRGAIAAGKASALAEEVLSAIRTVYTFNEQQKEVDNYRVHLASARRIDIWKDCSLGLTVGLVLCSTFFIYGLSFYFGIKFTINEPEKYDAGIMFSVIMGTMMGMQSFGMIAQSMSSIGSARGAAAHIYSVLNNVPSINPQLDKGIRPVIMGNVELKNVIFRYPNRPQTAVLSDVSLSVKRGQSVALVGPSGCGKSTVVQLIFRGYDVESGNVYVDGHDVRDLSVRWLRLHIGLVAQEPVLYNTTVRENIRYGRDDASDAEIEQAARQANAHHFIMKLPKKYDTRVGEGGASLSGGQKQRIAIARALVRNPPILLLDEATSALDTASEAVVQQALDTASKGRTTVTVAHRLSTIRNVDLIYVMKNGKIIEVGTHLQLMEKKGLYYEMVTFQEPIATDTIATKTPKREEATEEKTIQKIILRWLRMVKEKIAWNTANLMENEEAEGKQMDVAHRKSEDVSKLSMKTEDEEFTEINMEEKEKKEKSLSFLRVMKLNAPEWKSVTIGCLLAAVTGFSQPLIFVVFGDLFGEMSNPDIDVLMQTTKRVALILIGIGLGIFLCTFCSTLSFGIAGAYLTERLRYQMFEHLLRQPVGFFDETANSTGALCARLSSEAAEVQGATGQKIAIILQFFGGVLLAIIMGFYYEWRCALVAVAFIPLLVIAIYYEMKATKIESETTIKSLESSTKVAVEAVSNIRTTVSLGLEPYILRTYEENLVPVLILMRRTSQLRGLVDGLSRSLLYFLGTAILTYGGHLIVSDAVRYEKLLVSFQTLQIAIAVSQQAFSFLNEVHKGSLAATRIINMLNIEPSMRNPEVPVITPFKSKGNASFKAVEFRYPTRRGQKVLQGLNLLVEDGKTFALVGESGCGKSTVISLLQRYYDPDSGIVALENIPLPQLLMHEVRANLGLVSQEPVLFHRTVRENIAYGDNSRTPTHMEVEDAAKAANIHSFIATLPQGYETNLGTKGLQLSGGQKQRVAIARALIRKPKILLLDEATSALDTESEKIVQEALDRAKAGRTCLMIAHRLSTVRDADAICVLKEGRLVEQGTHAELMAKNGYYYRLHQRM